MNGQKKRMHTIRGIKGESMSYLILITLLSMSYNNGLFTGDFCIKMAVIGFFVWVIDNIKR